MPTKNISGQYPLDLAPIADPSAQAFLHGQSNAQARARLAGPNEWANHCLSVFGPKGCGKTHIGMIWAEENEAYCLSAAQPVSPIAAWQGQCIWIDDAQRADEFSLFTLINMAILGDIKALLLTSRAAPKDWPVQLPDLASRLRNLQAVSIQPPDDDLLRSIISNLFLERGLRVAPKLTDYLLSNTDRSISALRAVIRDLDQAAAAKKTNLTRAFAAKFLKD